MTMVVAKHMDAMPKLGKGQGKGPGTGQVQDQQAERLWGTQYSSVEERFPGLTGRPGAALYDQVVAAYQDCDALVLECNHEPDLLAAGPYPASLKRRVGGNLGHLSNQQAAAHRRGRDSEGALRGARPPLLREPR